jgi:hypothetical protein
MAQAIEAVDEVAELAAVTGAHLLVGAEKLLQPDMQWLVALEGLDDPGCVAELVVKSHVVL